MRARLSLCLLVLVAALSACTAVTTAGGRHLRVTSEAFRSYVESVFREQNRVETKLSFALAGSALSDADRTALQEADTALLDACAGLNEIATSRENQERMGKLRQLRAARRAPVCEKTTERARDVLARHGPKD